MQHPLVSYIHHCIPVHTIQAEQVVAYFTEKKLPKKTILLQEGEVCHFEAFVLEGCLKNYFIDENGFEIILNFPVENWWVSDLVSFHDRAPASFNIETIETTRLLIIDREGKERLLQDFPQLERMFRLMVQRHLGSFQQRLFQQNALSAKERYAIFMEKYPNLLQRIPQYLIASYLGISPEFLSRLRKKS